MCPPEQEQQLQPWERMTLLLGEVQYRIDRAIVGDPGWTIRFVREAVMSALDEAHARSVAEHGLEAKAASPSQCGHYGPGRTTCVYCEAESTEGRLSHGLQARPTYAEQAAAFNVMAEAARNFDEPEMPPACDDPTDCIKDEGCWCRQSLQGPFAEPEGRLPERGTTQDALDVLRVEDYERWREITGAEDRLDARSQCCTADAVTPNPVNKVTPTVHPAPGNPEVTS